MADPLPGEPWHLPSEKTPAIALAAANDGSGGGIIPEDDFLLQLFLNIKTIHDDAYSGNTSSFLLSTI
jgi:hypothetical protein